MRIIEFFKGQRVATATVFLIIALIALAYGGIFLALFIGLLSYLGTKELDNLLRAKGINISFPLTITIIATLIIYTALKMYAFIAFVFILGIITSFILILTRGKNAKINDLSGMIFSIIYGGLLPMHIMMLRDLNTKTFDVFNYNVSEGLAYIIIMFVVISLSDIAAYYVGTKFGKTPLFPSISPKKTVEGALGGLLASMTVALLLGITIGLNPIISITAGLLLSITSMFGDLCESMLKRDAGIKDSGTLIPGHGGVLDRADSYIFTGAVAYYFFIAINSISNFI